MGECQTVGYGDKEFEDFVELLNCNGIDRVVDVRSFPRFKWPEYEKENLGENLPERGIDYVHLKRLGGYRDEGYENYTNSDDFEEGLRNLTDLAEEKTTAIMCLESYPSGCHRRYIAHELEELGWDVRHIVGKRGKIKNEV